MDRTTDLREERHRLPIPALLLGALWILLFAVSLLSPLQPQGPFDVRTGERVPGAHLRMPAAAVAIEPLAAPAHILAGAPDYRAAGAATLLWVALVTTLIVWLCQRRAGHHELSAATFRSLAMGLGTSLLLLTWVAFAVLVRVPGWRLEVDDPALAVLDLQSHTYGSRDGVVSARDNLLTHADHGFGVVAITEHQDPAGAYEAQRVARSLGPAVPEVLAGIELRGPLRAFLLGIGLREDLPAPQRNREYDAVFEGRFIEGIHQAHGGAVLALSYRMLPEDARRLADLGVDGFEIANFGHPGLPPAVRETLLELWRERGMVLVASSDWHGWGGLFRTWTLARLPPATADTPGAASRVVKLLRERRADAFIPLVAGHMASPSPWRVAFAPFVETGRYLLELSPLRVVAWGMWGWCLWVLAMGLARRGRRPGWALLAVLLAVFAVGLGYRGMDWLLAWGGGHTNGTFAGEVGGGVLAGAVLCLVAACGALRRSKAGVSG